MKVNRVWGSASGKHRTCKAARGALTWVEYSLDFPLEPSTLKKDFLQIISIEKDVEEDSTERKKREDAKAE